MQKQTVSFSRTLTCLALVGLLAFSANNAVGQISIGGTPQMYYYDDAEEWRYYQEVEFNGSTGVASVRATEVPYYLDWVVFARYALVNNGSIGTATASGNSAAMYGRGYSGFIVNYGQIGNATVYDWGDILNRGYIDNYYDQSSEVSSSNVGLVNEGTVGTVYASVRAVANGYSGTINTAYITDTQLQNNWGGTIGTIHVRKDGYVWNIGGHIGTVYLEDNSEGRNNGTIGTLFVRSYGKFENLFEATIDSAIVSNGNVVNVGTINNVTFNGGTVSSSGTWQWGPNGGTRLGTINEATVNGGQLDNNGWGLVENLTVNGGNVTNIDNGIIKNVTLNGGIVGNHDSARIDNLTYFGGLYDGKDLWGWGIDTGTIGTLTLASDSSGIDWGIVENVRFSSNGAGILSISAFGGFSPNSFEDIQPMSASIVPMSFAPLMTFSGINAQNIDLTNGNILLDLSGFGDNGDAFIDAFSLSALFGGANVEGNFNAFQVVMGGEFNWEVELLAFLGDMFEGDWQRNDLGLVFGDFPRGGGNEVPEPATLAVLGLGLVGLGWARRRQLWLSTQKTSLAGNNEGTLFC